MHLRCVCVLLLVGVDVIWAGLTRELSSYFLLVNFKIVEGHNTDLLVIFTILRFHPLQNPEMFLSLFMKLTYLSNIFAVYFRGF